MEKKRGPGRPTDKKKDATLKLRIDKETHDLLNEYARKKGMSMSQLLRQEIESIIADKKQEI